MERPPLPASGLGRRRQGRAHSFQPGHRRDESTAGEAALQFWTSEELTVFLAWLDRKASAHEQALYRLAAQTGMRGKLLGLRWYDLARQGQRASPQPQSGHPTLREAPEGAGVKRIRFHDLQHMSAVIGLRELGEWPDEVSKRLGHMSVAFTLDTYGHLLPQRRRAAADAFDRLLAERRRTDTPPPD